MTNDFLFFPQDRPPGRLRRMRREYRLDEDSVQSSCSPSNVMPVAFSFCSVSSSPPGWNSPTSSRYSRRLRIRCTFSATLTIWK